MKRYLSFFESNFRQSLILPFLLSQLYNTLLCEFLTTIESFVLVIPECPLDLKQRQCVFLYRCIYSCLQLRIFHRTIAARNFLIPPSDFFPSPLSIDLAISPSFHLRIVQIECRSTLSRVIRDEPIGKNRCVFRAAGNIELFKKNGPARPPFAVSRIPSAFVQFALKAETATSRLNSCVCCSSVQLSRHEFSVFPVRGARRRRLFICNI